MCISESLIKESARPELDAVERSVEMLNGTVEAVVSTTVKKHLRNVTHAFHNKTLHTNLGVMANAVSGLSWWQRTLILVLCFIAACCIMCCVSNSCGDRPSSRRDATPALEGLPLIQIRTGRR